MPRAGLKPMIPVFKRSKIVRASDRAAIGIGFFKFNLILSYQLRPNPTGGLFISSFLTKILYAFLSPIRAACTAHLALLDFITFTIFGEEYRLWSPSLCSFLQSSDTSSLLGQHSVLKIPSICVLPLEWKTGKIIVLYTLIFALSVLRLTVQNIGIIY